MVSALCDGFGWFCFARVRYGFHVRVRFPFEARFAKTIDLDLSLFGFVIGHFPDDAGCLVHLRFRFGNMRFEHACFR